MAIVRCFFIPPDEFEQRRRERDAKLDPIKARLDALGMSWSEQCKQPEVIPLLSPNYLGAGAMWYAPWYYDPTDEADRARKGHAGPNLSKYYWEDWSDKRPPLVVVTPNLRTWCVDQKSSNGEGWKVTGLPPLLVCRPSINVPGYHGYLGRDEPGVFTEPM